MDVAPPEDTDRKSSPISVQTILLGSLLALALLLFLRATSWITAPLAFAFFLTLAILPVDELIARRLPNQLRWLGHVAALVIILLVIACFLTGIVFSAHYVAVSLPRYEQSLQTILQWISSLSTDLGGAPEDGGLSGDMLVQRGVDFATSILGTIWSSGAVLIVIFFFVTFMLVEAEAFKAKIASISTPSGNRHSQIALDAIAHRVRRYLLVRTSTGLLTAGLYMLWSWWWNIDLVLAWGTLAFFLNFIPTLGSILVGGALVLFAVIQLGLAQVPLFALGIFLIEQVMGNYLEPRLQGRQLALSAVSVLAALLLWSWIWGWLGALLAVPMMLMITIVFAHIPALRPVALLLSDATNIDDLKTKMSPS